MLQFKCLRLAIGAPWYVSNRQIHEDLGVLFFADHIRALFECFDSKLADVGIIITANLHIPKRIEGSLFRLTRKSKLRATAGQSRASPAFCQVD